MTCTEPPSFHDADLRRLPPIDRTRPSGKSQLLAAMALSELFTKPNAYVLMIADGRDQATAIFTRKIARPLDALLRELGLGKKDVAVTKNGVEIPALASMLEVIPT